MGKEERHPEQRQKRDRNAATKTVGFYRPAAGDSRQCRDCAERQRHAGKHRQSAADEGAVGPRKHERKNRENTRADDRKNAPDIGKEEQDHLLNFSLRRLRAGATASSSSSQSSGCMPNQMMSK